MFMLLFCRQWLPFMNKKTAASIRGTAFSSFQATEFLEALFKSASLVEDQAMAFIGGMVSLRMF
jgi:hypothetical protein